MCLLYFAHSTIISNIGFTSTLNQFLIGMFQVIVIPVIFIFSPEIPRRLSGIVTYSICTILSILTGLIVVPADC